MSTFGTTPAHTRKADHVYDALRAEFIRGEWPFGQTFSTYDLAERFGLSRRPVMDAVAKLESVGFVEVIPQVGCRVVVPDETRVREHFELAGALEGTASKLAAGHVTDSSMARLAALHASGGPIVDAGDGAAFAEHNRDLHAAILEVSGNQTIASLARGAWDLRDFYLSHYLYERPRDDLRLRHAEHGEILDAIAARDAEAARARMEDHLARFAREVTLPATAGSAPAGPVPPT